MTENLNPHYVVRREGMRNADYDTTGYDGPQDLADASSIARSKASRDADHAWLVLHDHGGGHFERHVVARFAPQDTEGELVDSPCTNPPLHPRSERVPLDAPLPHGHRHGPLPVGVEPVDAALRAELDRRFGTPATDRVARMTGAAVPAKHGHCWHGNEAAECTLGHTAKDWAEFYAASAGTVDPS